MPIDWSVEVKAHNGTFNPVDPARLSHELADGINRVVLDPALREKFEHNGCTALEDHFSWTVIAHRTLDLYNSLLA